MGAGTNRRRLWAIVGSAMVVLSVGVAVVVTAPNPTTYAATSQLMLDSQAEVAVWAGVNGLRGLSPAGLAVPVSSFGQSEVAAWADVNGLTGLSPASLRGGSN
jgi:apolipoprotein N-acyltransferase